MPGMDRSLFTFFRINALVYHLAGIIFLTGCQTGTVSRAEFSGGPIDQLYVLTFPLAVNLDNQPGSDGFAIKVYAAHHTHPKPRAITRGILEIHLFDGAMNAGKPFPSPLRVWQFPASELKSFLFQASIGPGYEFTLPWGQARPTQKRASIVVRMVEDGTVPFEAEPVVIEIRAGKSEVPVAGGKITGPR